MVWTVIWLMLLLIPIGGLCWIVWWVIRKTDERPAVSGDDDGGGMIRVRSSPYPRAPRPRSARRSTTRRCRRKISTGAKMKRMTPVAVTIGFVLIASGLAAGASFVWTGMGAKLSNWTKVHPKHSTGCPSGGCYGRRVSVAGKPTDRFVLVSTTGTPAYRVDGYVQAIGDGTPVAAAKVAVLKLLSSDTKTTSFRIAHYKGDSCALWNVQSKPLARWFGGKKVGDSAGVLGIDLNTPTSHGHVYRAADVSEASVGLRANDKSTTC